MTPQTKDLHGFFITLMKRVNFSSRFLFLATAVCAVALSVYLHPSLPATFMRMHRSSKQTSMLQLYSFFNLSDINRPDFEDGVNPVLLPVLEQIEEPLPSELLEYLSTSMPKKEYNSYGWEFLPAERVAELNTDAEICSVENGYFVIAWTSFGYGAVSLEDGRIYVGHGFKADVGFSSPYCEAESISDFLRKETQEWVDYEW